MLVSVAIWMGALFGTVGFLTLMTVGLVSWFEPGWPPYFRWIGVVFGLTFVLWLGFTIRS